MIGYLALQDTNVVGTCAFTASPREGKVEIAYFTFPAFEGRGIGTAMARKLIQIARADVPAIIVTAQTLPRRNASTPFSKNLGSNSSQPSIIQRMAKFGSGISRRINRVAIAYNVAIGNS